MKNLLLLLVLLLTVSSCTKRNFQCRDYFSRYPNTTGEENFLNAVIQSSKNKMVYAVIFTSNSSQTAFDAKTGRVNSILGEAINPSLNKRAIYVLQPDKTLKELNFNDEKLIVIFEAIEKHKLHKTQLFKDEIAKELHFFETK